MSSSSSAHPLHALRSLHRAHTLSVHSSRMVQDGSGATWTPNVTLVSQPCRQVCQESDPVPSQTKKEHCYGLGKEPAGINLTAQQAPFFSWII